jgi:TonB family protein
MTATPQVRHTRGLIVVVILAVIFLALIAALVITTGKPHPTRSVQAESLSVMPLRVRLRTEPKPAAPVVATATMGETLTVLEDRDRWVRVQNDEGLSGWAERAMLERTAERRRRLARYEAIRKLPVLNGIVRQRASLYAGPGIFYPIIGDIPSETQVKIYTRDHDFYAVEHNGEIAYADIDAIDVSSAGTRQFDVSSQTPASTEEPVAPPSPTDTTASATPPTLPAPQPVPVEPEPAPSPVDPGIYSAVPLGGTQPEELDRVIPRYPPIARRAGVQGAVVVRGVVRKDGRIDDIEVIKDLPYGLGDAAREAVSRWKFRPATYKGQPIDVYYTVTVNFRLTQ